jgi:hypothetical protein
MGLLKWLQQLNPSDSVAAQFELNRKVASASLSVGTPNLIALEVHCTTLLSNWYPAAAPGNLACPNFHTREMAQRKAEHDGTAQAARKRAAGPPPRREQSCHGPRGDTAGDELFRTDREDWR